MARQDAAKLLKRVKPRVRKGLTASAIRLITREPEPPAKARQTEKVVVSTEHHQRSTKAQLDRRLKNRKRKRTAKHRS